MKTLPDSEYLAACLYELRKAENAFNGLDKDNLGPERTKRYANVLQAQKAYDEALAITKKAPATP